MQIEAILCQLSFLFIAVFLAHWLAACVVDEPCSSLGRPRWARRLRERRGTFRPLAWIDPGQEVGWFDMGNELEPDRTARFIPKEPSNFRASSKPCESRCCLSDIESHYSFHLWIENQWNKWNISGSENREVASSLCKQANNAARFDTRHSNLCSQEWWKLSEIW